MKRKLRENFVRSCSVTLRCWLVAAVSASPQPSSAEPIRLLADLVTESGPSGSFPHDFTSINGVVYFAAQDEAHGDELWRTDGTPAGTRRLVDFCPGACWSLPATMVALGGDLLLSAFTNETGRGLFRVDPESGEHELLAAPCGPACDSSVSVLARVGARVFFSATDLATGAELWVTDGTRAGTRRVADLCAGGCSSELFFTSASALGDRLVFAARTPGSGRELWISDGTAAGTRLLRDICVGCDSFPAPLGVVGGALYFTAFSREHGIEPWVTDGTPAGTRLLKDLLPGSESSAPRDFANFGGQVYIATQICDGGHGCLWRTDGTTAGTLRVPISWSGNSARAPCGLVPLGGRLLLRVSEDTCRSFGGWELWAASPGVTAVERVADGFHNLLPLAVSGGRAFFRGTTAAEGEELWVSDGTAAGTRLVQDANPGPDGSFPLYAAAVPGGIVYSASLDLSNSELWVSDGSPGGTAQLAELRPDLASSFPEDFLAAGQRVLFAARNLEPEGLGSAIFSSDGTSALRLQDGFPSFDGVAAGAVSYFVGPGAGLDAAIYRTDGTPAGTAAIVSSPDLPQFLTPLGTRLFYGEQSHGQRLWVSDGTAGTARLVIDVNPSWDNRPIGPFDPKLTPPLPLQPPFPQGLIAVGDRLFFVAYPEGGPVELWVSDGTTAGTRSVRGFPVAAGGPEPLPGELTRFGNRLLFAADQDTTGRELWRSDGSAAGTVLVADLVPGTGSSSPRALRVFGQRATFFAKITGGGEALWRTDGTAGGTASLKTFEAFGGEAVVAGGRLFFTAHTPEEGTELWVSDSTTTGTRLVRDVHPGPLGAGIGELTAVGSRVVFAADDGTHGQELWVSDGTAAGTRLVEDLVPGAAASDPQHLARAGGKLYFAAFHPEHGREPFVVPLSALGSRCQPSPERLCLGDGRFAVTVHWQNPRNGAAGAAGALPYGEDSGFFWFFRPENRELVLKVLDGRGVNGHFWVFAGATTDVEYTVLVEDLETGEVFEHTNPGGSVCGFAATDALPAPGGALPADPANAAKGLPPPAAITLLGGRFRLTAEWVNHHAGAGGAGTPVTLSDQSTSFWFFRPENLELLVKMVDGRAVNGKFWLFFGALSNLEFRLHVTDTVTGQSKTYENRVGTVCGQADVSAF